MKQHIEENRGAATGKELDGTFRQVPLAPLFGRLSPSLPTECPAKLFPLSASDPCVFVARGTLNLCLHLLHRARNLVSDLSNLDVAHDLFELGRHAVRFRDRVAQAYGPAHDLEISAASATIMLALGRVGSALRTEHIKPSPCIIVRTRVEAKPNRLRFYRHRCFGKKKAAPFLAAFPWVFLCLEAAYCPPPAVTL